MPTANLAEELIRLTYRLDLTEQVMLRLLRELAAVNPTAATRLADQVRARARRQGTRRQSPHELAAQVSMLELLNNVAAAASPRPERGDDDG